MVLFFITLHEHRKNLQLITLRRILGCIPELLNTLQRSLVVRFCSNEFHVILLNRGDIDVVVFAMGANETDEDDLDVITDSND